MSDGNGTQKTGAISGNGRFERGPDPRRGHGVKGRSGRPPNWLREFCDEALSDPKCKAAVRAILRNRSHPAFATMWKAAGERAHGKPEQPISVSVNPIEDFLLKRHAARTNENGHDPSA